MKRVGVALGGGGVRGMAHVAALETIDACGIRPSVIAGTSMGAIIGALYASGQSGKSLREGIESHIVTHEDRFKDILSKTPRLVRWLRVVSAELGRGGFLKADGFLKYLFAAIGVTTFEELRIPLHVVATDFWTGEEVVISSGELLPAIMASMAIPGVFAPVVIGDRVLVDGGIVNNVPYDLLKGECECSVAIDVAPDRSVRENRVPNIIDATLGMFDMLVEKVMEGKRQEGAPTIYFRPGDRGRQGVGIRQDRIGPGPGRCRGAGTEGATGRANRWRGG